MKLPIAAFNLNMISKMALFIIDDFNYTNNPSIKLSSGLYGGKNINSILFKYIGVLFIKVLSMEVKKGNAFGCDMQLNVILLC